MAYSSHPINFLENVNEFSAKCGLYSLTDRFITKLFLTFISYETSESGKLFFLNKAKSLSQYGFFGWKCHSHSGWIDYVDFFSSFDVICIHAIVYVLIGSNIL